MDLVRCALNVVTDRHSWQQSITWCAGRVKRIRYFCGCDSDVFAGRKWLRRSPGSATDVPVTLRPLSVLIVIRLTANAMQLEGSKQLKVAHSMMDSRTPVAQLRFVTHWKSICLRYPCLTATHLQKLEDHEAANARVVEQSKQALNANPMDNLTELQRRTITEQSSRINTRVRATVR